VRELAVIQAEIDEYEAKRDRLKSQVEAMMFVDKPDDKQLERSDRLMTGFDRASARLDRLREELGEAIGGDRKAKRLEALRSKALDSRNLENGDGAAPPYESREPQRHTQHDDIVRSAALRHIDQLSRVDDIGRSLSSTQLDKLDALIRRADEDVDGGYVAQRILLTETPEYRSAFMKYMRSVARATPMMLSTAESDAVARFQEFELRRAMSENTTTAGGFGIPGLVDPTIIVTSAAADAPLLRVCRIEQVTNNVWKGISSAGMTWSFDTEGAEVSDDSPTLVQPSVTVHTARGFIPYSLEVGMDYGNFAMEMAKLLDSGYTDLLAAKTMTGSGSGEPWGIFTAIDQTTASEVATTTDGSFGGEDIFAVWNSLPERYRGRATWIMSVHVQSAIRKFAASATTNSAYFTIDLTGGSFRINDRPVIITDYAPTFATTVPGTTGAANILVVGDTQQYLVAQRAGMSVEQIPHLFHTSNNRPSGQRAIFAWARVGADSVNDAGWRLLQNQ
jgi:HK97 family phage major capsid protein